MRHEFLSVVYKTLGIAIAIALPFCLAEGATAQVGMSASSPEVSSDTDVANKQVLVQKIPRQRQLGNPGGNTDDNVFSSPAGDVSIYIPGEVTANQVDELSSVSNATSTVYSILFRETPPEFSSYSPAQIQEVLTARLLGFFQEESARVLDSNTLSIAGYPGIEAIVENRDGSTARFQTFVIGQNMYVLAAITTSSLTSEVDQFFSSFTYYSNQADR
jgi:hypothetical protein